MKKCEICFYMYKNEKMNIIPRPENKKELLCVCNNCVKEILKQTSEARKQLPRKESEADKVARELLEKQN